ncbi:MAG: hypothetical protein ABJG47_13030 [Ekhidna sp.]
MGQILRNEWMEIFPWKHVQPWGQSFSKVKCLETNLIEVIKYGSKIFTEPDLESKSKKTVSPYVYVSALDNILTVMSKRRIFDRFGFNVGKKNEATASSVEFNLKEWKFEMAVNDWLRSATGDLLVKQDLPKNLLSLLKNNLNLELD